MVEIQNGAITAKISNTEQELRGKVTSSGHITGKVGMAPGNRTQFHNELVGREESDSHPMEAITNLTQALDAKISSTDVLTNRDIENLLNLFM